MFEEEERNLKSLFDTKWKSQFKLKLKPSDQEQTNIECLKLLFNCFESTVQTIEIKTVTE